MSPNPPEHNRPGTERDTSARPQAPLPAETLQDRHAIDALHRQRESWADEAYQEYARTGDFEHLPGWGKPLVVPTGDPFESLLKNANIQPPWMLLRTETGKLLERAVSLLKRGPSVEEEIEELIGHINKLIGEMNDNAPSLSLHRNKITRGTLLSEYDKWK